VIVCVCMKGCVVIVCVCVREGLCVIVKGKCFHHQQEAEKGVQEPLKSRTTDFYAIGISKLISH